MALFLATPGTPALAHGVEEGGWGAAPPWAYFTVVLAVVISGLLLGARGAFRRQPRTSACGTSAVCRSYRPLAAMCCLGAGAVHLLVAPEHFQEWWGYGCFFLALATFQTLYGLGLAAPAGRLPRREAYLLVGITANLLVLGLYAVSRTRGIPLFGPHVGELEPLSGPDILAATLETGALALLTWDLRRVASPGRTMATLLQCVGPAAAAILTLAACVSPAEAGEHDGATGGPAGHHSQGLPLAAGAGRETVTQGGRCPPGAPVREYRVAAINVEITLNRFLDYDPKGRMYVLEEELERVRQEEARNRAARAGKGDPAISHGLQGDAIQPLTIRVNQGECLRVALRNALDNNEPASFHLHGSALYVAATGAPALAANPDATASPGAAVTYEWWVSDTRARGHPLLPQPRQHATPDRARPLRRGHRGAQGLPPPRPGHGGAPVERLGGHHPGPARPRLPGVRPLLS